MAELEFITNNLHVIFSVPDMQDDVLSENGLYMFKVKFFTLICYIVYYCIICVILKMA